MSKDILYLKSNIKNCEYLYSGISFNDFIKSLNNKFENIVLLKADYIGNSFRRNFEIIEGIENIIKLAKEDIYGDFSFVDCSKNDSIEKLEDMEIAELLFLEHMKYPLNSPFFDALGNRFVYLSHDNDFYCKLYCKTENDILNMLSYKIQNKLTKLICGLTSKPSDLSFRFTIKSSVWLIHLTELFLFFYNFNFKYIYCIYIWTAKNSLSIFLIWNRTTISQNVNIRKGNMHSHRA